MDLSHLRSDGVRAADQHTLHKARRAGDGTDLDGVASNVNSLPHVDGTVYSHPS
jgi:hypothetical protein